jgi:hypothetical protein
MSAGFAARDGTLTQPKERPAKPAGFQCTII